MVSLRELTPEHFEFVARWLSDPEINRWLSSEWRRKDVAPSMIAIAVRNRRNRLFLVMSDDNPCGIVALSDLEPEDGTANVWYFLGDRTLSGKGITSAAVRELVRLAFGQLGLASLSAWAMEGNVASQRLLRQVGFRELGRMRHSARYGEQRVDRIYFDLLPGELR